MRPTAITSASRTIRTPPLAAGIEPPLATPSDDIDDAIANKPERDPAEAWHDLSHLVGILRALELRCRP